MKFSKGQILLLINMQDESRVGIYEDGYYAETGSCKPFAKSTINSLVKKNIVKVLKTACHDTIFYCAPGPKFDTVPKLTWSDYHSAK